MHRATLKNGQEVAVKVQHPYVMGNSKVDMKTMEYLCKIMSIVFPDFKMQWLVDESKKNLPIELDFLNEGRNAEKVTHSIHLIYLNILKKASNERKKTSIIFIPSTFFLISLSFLYHRWRKCSKNTSGSKCPEYIGIFHQNVFWLWNI